MLLQNKYYKGFVVVRRFIMFLGLLAGGFYFISLIFGFRHELWLAKYSVNVKILDERTSLPITNAYALLLLDSELINDEAQLERLLSDSKEASILRHKFNLKENQNDGVGHDGGIYVVQNQIQVSDYRNSLLFSRTVFMPLTQSWLAIKAKGYKKKIYKLEQANWKRVKEPGSYNQNMGIVKLKSLDFTQPEFSIDSSYKVKFKIKSSKPELFIKKSQLKATVYASDSIFADASASIIKADYFSNIVEGGEYSIDFNGLELSRALTNYYKQGGGDFSPDSHQAEFYIVWELDINGDGQLCTGDMIMDYKKTTKSSYNVLTGSRGVDDLVSVYFKIITEPVLCNKDFNNQ